MRMGRGKKIGMSPKASNAIKKIVEILFEIANQEGISKADKVMMEVRVILKKRISERNNKGNF